MRPAENDTHCYGLLRAANGVRLRAERGLRQEALAMEAGLHRTFVAHVERQTRNISLDNIEELAAGLSVPVDAPLAPPGDDRPCEP